LRVITLVDAGCIYACSETARLSYHSLQCPALKAFCIALDQLEHILGELSEDEYWITFLRQARRYRFQMCAAPFSPDQQRKITQELVSNLRHHLRHCDQMYADRLARLGHTILDQADFFAHASSNPLLDAVSAMCTDGGCADRALLVKDSRLIPVAEAALATHESTRHVSVVCPSQLNSGHCYPQMIIMGPSRWYPDSVFSAPRANRLDVVRFAWISDRWQPSNAFLGSILPSIRHDSPEAGMTRELPSSDEFWLVPDGLLPAVNLMRALSAFESSSVESSCAGDDLVDARGYHLAGGMAVFLETEEKASVLTIDPNEDDRRRVKRVPIGDIEPGIYILLRTSGSGDYVVPIADRIMGSAAKRARERQRYWKDKLRALASHRGLLETSILLLDHGSQVANEQNLRNWMSYRTIRTQDKRDFIAIMRATGLEAETDLLWQEMGGIHTAHMRAGMEIRRLLLKQAAGTNLSELERAGQIEFALEGSDTGSLTAFRVEEASNETALIPSHLLGRPFDAGE